MYVNDQDGWLGTVVETSGTSGGSPWDVRDFLAFGDAYRVTRGLRILQILLDRYGGVITCYEIFRGLYLIDREPVRHVLLRTAYEVWTNRNLHQSGAAAKHERVFDYTLCAFEQDRLLRIMDAFQCTPKPLVNLQNINRRVNDGSVVGICVGSPHYSIRYTLHTGTQSEWTTLLSWVEGCMEEFEVLLSSSGGPVDTIQTPQPGDNVSPGE